MPGLNCLYSFLPEHAVNLFVNRLVENAELGSWKEVLCAVVVYCTMERRLLLAGQFVYIFIHRAQILCGT